MLLAGVGVGVSVGLAVGGAIGAVVGDRRARRVRRAVEPLGASFGAFGEARRDVDGLEAELGGSVVLAGRLELELEHEHEHALEQLERSGPASASAVEATGSDALAEPAVPAPSPRRATAACALTAVAGAGAVAGALDGEGHAWASAGRLVLALRDGRVAIEPPCMIARGSVESIAPLAAARAWALTGMPGSAPAWPAPRFVRTLAAGDAVLASGVLRRAARDEHEHEHEHARPREHGAPSERAAAYRSAPRGPRPACALALAAGPGVEAVRLAYDGAPRPLEGLLERAGRAALGGAVAGAVLFGLAGAAVPGPSSARAPAPIAALEPTCPSDLDARIARFERSAADAAEACGDAGRAARAWFVVGDFERASLVFVRAGGAATATVTEVAAHLFAGRQRESALAARRLALAPQTKPEVGPMLGCYADALEARAGDAEARGRLEASATKASAADPCVALFVDAATGAARVEAIARTAWPRSRPYWARERDWHASLSRASDLDAYVLALLHVEVDREQPLPRPVWYASDALGDPAGPVMAHPVGLEAAVREHHGASSGVEFALQLAVFESAFGDHARAAAEIERAYALGGVGAVDAARPPGQAFAYRPCVAAKGCSPGELAERRLDYYRRAFFVGAVLATRAGEYASARELIGLAVEEANGKRVLGQVLDVRERGDRAALDALELAEHWPPHREAYAAAARGDAAKLVARLVAGQSDGRSVIPNVTRVLEPQRHVLATFVTEQAPGPCAECGPHALVAHVAARRDLLQAVGARGLERDLAVEAAAQSFRRAFLRRDVAVPLYVLGRVVGLKTW